MVKKLAEFIVFCFVLLQIAILTSYIKKDANPASAPIQASTAPVSHHHRAALKTMAEQEAKRIVETGDISRLQAEIDKNKPLLKVMGYHF